MPMPKKIASNLMDKEPVAGKMVKEVANEKSGTTEFTLSNGVTITIKPAKLKMEKVMKIYNEVFDNADGMHFTFVGNIDQATAKPLLEKYIGSLPAKVEAHQAKGNGVRPVSGMVEANIKKGKEAQSMVAVHFNGVAAYTPEANLIFSMMLNALNIRIVEILREEMSGMYSGGLNGNIGKRPYEHYSINATLPCGPENAEKLTTALFNIIKDAQTKGIEQKDLDKVKETLKKQYRTQIQTNDFWLTTLSNAWINQTPAGFVLNMEERIDAVTLKDIQEAAKQYFHFNNYVKVVLYPESANVKDDIQKKGF